MPLKGVCMTASNHQLDPPQETTMTETLAAVPQVDRERVYLRTVSASA